MGTLAPLATLASDLVPPRLWLDRLALLVPGSTATRWLLLADAACLVAMGGATRWPFLGIPAALVSGFVALNLMGMAVTDFYLGLALFHLAVGVTTAAVPHRARWAGASLVMLALALGILT